MTAPRRFSFWGCDICLMPLRRVRPMVLTNKRTGEVIPGAQVCDACRQASWEPERHDGPCWNECSHRARRTHSNPPGSSR